MATISTYTIDHSAGTLTFDLRDFVPSPDMPSLPGPYLISENTVTYKIAELPLGLKVTL